MGIPGDYQYKALHGNANFIQSNWHFNKLVVLETLLNLSKNTRVLNLGCGSGNFKISYASSVKEIVSVDYNDGAIGFLKSEIKKRNPNAKILIPIPTIEYR